MTQQNSTNAAGAAGFIETLKTNKSAKWLTTGVVALVLLVGGYFAYQKFYAEPKDEKNQVYIAQAFDLFSGAVQAQMQYNSIENLPDSTLAQMLTAQGEIKAGLSKDSAILAVKDSRKKMQAQVTDLFNKVLKGDGKFPGLLKIAADGGNAGNIACYLSGAAYFNMGQYKEAIKQLEEFSPKSDNSVSPLAVSVLANAYACDNQIDKAIATFKKAADLADNEVMTPKFLLEAGKLLESQNKKEEANAIYVQIKKDYPQFGQNQQGMMSSEIDRYIERTK